jgi:WD40 repeat protein
MKPGTFSLLAALSLVCLGAVGTTLAQDSPDILWEAPSPSALANSIQGVGWSPGASGRVAVGSTDRWVRTRQASNGLLIYSVLQPHRSGGADQTIYSTDGLFLAVHNRSGGLGYRVHRAADGVFLGQLTVTADNNGIIRFAPDTQLLANTGGDGTLSRWRFAEFTVVVTVGSGYDRTTTTINFSPDNAYQSVASQGRITVQRRTDGSIVRVLAGGTSQGFAPVAFTPDSTRLAAWAASPNLTTLWRIADGAVILRLPGATPDEGVGAIRFTPDGERLVTTGYLPFVDPNGLWQQVGVIRFWRLADAALLNNYQARTGIAVTSPVAWSPDATQFAYGTYEGAVVVARTPAP